MSSRLYFSQIYWLWAYMVSAFTHSYPYGLIWSHHTRSSILWAYMVSAFTHSYPYGLIWSRIITWIHYNFCEQLCSQKLYRWNTFVSIIRNCGCAKPATFVPNLLHIMISYILNHNNIINLVSFSCTRQSLYTWHILLPHPSSGLFCS